MRTTKGGGCAASKGFVTPPAKVQTNPGQALGYHLSKFREVDLGKTYEQGGPKPVGLWYTTHRETWMKYIVQGLGIGVPPDAYDDYSDAESDQQSDQQSGSRGSRGSRGSHISRGSRGSRGNRGSRGSHTSHASRGSDGAGASVDGSDHLPNISETYPEDLFLHTLRLNAGARRCSISERKEAIKSTGSTRVPGTRKILCLESVQDAIDCYKIFGKYDEKNPFSSYVNFAKIALEYAGLEISFDCNYLTSETHADFENPSAEQPVDFNERVRWMYPILSLFDVCSGCIWDLAALDCDTRPVPIKLSELVAEYGPGGASAGASAGGAPRAGPTPSILAGTVASIIVLLASSFAGAAV